MTFNLFYIFFMFCRGFDPLKINGGLNSGNQQLPKTPATPQIIYGNLSSAVYEIPAKYSADITTSRKTVSN
jgi:hypothetical protein